MLTTALLNILMKLIKFKEKLWGLFQIYSFCLHVYFTYDSTMDQEIITNHW